ncbi:MAG: hypothetical protein GXX78_09005 [Bacteroidales bacterium]|nr:hypothetical protein [Bacteroidales bacterium]HPB04757.1 hypothetical protein [Prolixibacteraceae bacterium]
MKKPITIVSFFLFLLLAGMAFGQQIAPKASLDKNRIIIGDQVKLLLEVECGSNDKVKFPLLPDSIAPFIEITERSKIDSVSAGVNRKKLFQEYTITSFDSGYHAIPAFPFEIHTNGLTSTVETNHMTLEVHTLPKLDSLMQALKGPIDIKAPYEAPLTFKEIAPWIFGTILVAGLLFLIWYALRKRKDNQPLFAIPQKPKEPAHVIALRELDRIKEEKIWQQGKTKLYYSELTTVLRQYINDRFDIQAMEQTSIETIAAFKYRRSLVDEKSFENLQRILTNADLVKFAKYEPLPDENNMALVDSYFFVNQTKIVEMTTPKEEVDDREGDDVIIK